jgi:hypothetical protein
MSAKPLTVLGQSRVVDFPQKPAAVEIIDTSELAARTKLPASWIRSHCQPRCPVEERIPCLHFGKYIRFEWNSPQLNEWLASRRTR